MPQPPQIADMDAALKALYDAFERVNAAAGLGSIRMFHSTTQVNGTFRHVFGVVGSESDEICGRLVARMQVATEFERAGLPDDPNDPEWLASQELSKRMAEMPASKVPSLRLVPSGGESPGVADGSDC